MAKKKEPIAKLETGVAPVQVDPTQGAGSGQELPTGGADQESQELPAGGTDQATQELQTGGASQATQELPAGGAGQATQELPAGGADQATQELPTGGADQESQELPAGGTDQATQELPAGGTDQATQELPAGGADQATQELPAGGAGQAGQAGQEVLATLETTSLTVVLDGVGVDKDLVDSSVAAWITHFPHLQNILVLGHALEMVRQSEDPAQHRVDCLAAAVASGWVTDRFVFAPVCMIPVSPLCEAEFDTHCEFEGYYSRKYPRALRKETVAHCIKEYPADKVIEESQRHDGYIPFPLPKIQRIVSSNPDIDKVREAISQNKYLYIENVEGFHKIKELL